MNSSEMKQRTKRFALRVVRLVDALPQSQAAQIIGKQLLRCGTSVGANYRAACRAKSTADFVAKMGIVEEEADETVYWMELLVESQAVPKHLVSDLMNEANEIVAITVSSILTARRHLRTPKSPTKPLSRPARTNNEGTARRL